MSGPILRALSNNRRLWGILGDICYKHYILISLKILHDTVLFVYFIVLYGGSYFAGAYMIYICIRFCALLTLEFNIVG
jgi:hypothetical protein